MGGRPRGRSRDAPSKADSVGSCRDGNWGHYDRASGLLGVDRPGRRRRGFIFK